METHQITGHTFDKFLVSDEKREELLNDPTKKYMSLGNFGENKNLLVHIPYIPLTITTNND